MKKIWIVSLILIVLVILLLSGLFLGGTSSLSKNIRDIYFCNNEGFAKIDVGEETSSVACIDYCESKYRELRAIGKIEEGHCYCEYICPKKEVKQ